MNIILLFYVSVLGAKSLAFELTVLHVNDIHSKLEEINQHSGVCEAADRGNKKY